MRRRPNPPARPRKTAGTIHIQRRRMALASSRGVRLNIRSPLFGRLARLSSGAEDRQGHPEEIAVVGKRVETGDPRALPDVGVAAMQTAAVAEAPGDVEDTGHEVDPP